MLQKGIIESFLKHLLDFNKSEYLYYAATFNGFSVFSLRFWYFSEFQFVTSPETNFTKRFLF